MAYEGGKTRDFFPRGLEGITRRTARDMATEGGKFMNRGIRDKTPVKTGRSRRSIRRRATKPVLRTRNVEIWESTNFSNLLTVLWLEYGTRPHVIQADDKMLKFKKDGETYYARRVKHPGTDGLHMFAITAVETEAAFDALMRPIVATWAREVEARIKARAKR